MQSNVENGGDEAGVREMQVLFWRPSRDLLPSVKFNDCPPLRNKLLTGCGTTPYPM
jgi:hypothetical protein